MRKLGDLSEIEVFVSQSLAEAADHWQKLQRSACTSPFQKLEFAETYLASTAASGRQTQVLLLIGLKFGDPIFLFPFEMISHPFGNRVTWLGQQMADYGHPLVHPTVDARILPRFLRFAASKLPELGFQVDNLALTRIPTNSKHFGASWSNFGHSRKSESSSHALRFEENWADQYSRLRSSRSRQRLRSKWTGLTKSGSVHFGRIRTEEARLLATHQILNWKSTQLAGARKRNPFSDSRSVLRNVVLAAVTSGQLEVFGLLLDGKLLAGSLVFRANSTMYLWICAYDPRSDSRFSPGTLHLLKSLELASRAGMQRFDFLVGDEKYKNDWCNEHVLLNHFFVDLTWRGRLDNTILQSRLVIKRFILRSPRLKRASELLMHELTSRLRSPGRATHPEAGAQKPQSQIQNSKPEMDIANTPAR